MNKYITLILLSCLLASCLSSNRVIDRSQKKTPGWIHGIPKEYVVAYGTGTTHEEAKQQAIKRVKEEIIKSIAVQVTVVESSTTSEDVDSFFESFNTETNVQSDYFEPLKGISINKVTDYYWENRKENGIERVIYYIKYPFPSSKLNQLIADYERINAEWTNELKAVTQKEYYTTVEELFEDIEKLDYLRKKLPNQRSTEAYRRKQFLEEKADDVRINILENKPGKVRYQLSSYGVPITTVEKPELFASCSIKIDKVIEYVDQIIIEYSIKDCAKEESNYLTVRYDLDGYHTKADFYIVHKK